VNSERHEREAELFDRACDLAPDAQHELVARECAHDAQLATRVLALLERDRRPRTELDGSALAQLSPVGRAATPERLGPYRILGLLGRGGMGVVYLAEQDSPRRRVALKVIQSSFASEEMLRRFEHEARILGRLNHPGIAQIYEAGAAPGPRGPEPFLAMELVEGEPLVVHAEELGLDVAARLELIARVCDAVHHAHLKGVVHRDLKPSNVLVDAAGTPKVLDFGVARATGADLDATSLHTAAGALVGTLPYMSPEQLEGRADAVDARSDVYALGVMTFELVAGRLPHEVAGLSVAAAARVLCEREAPRLGSLSGALRGEVETIVAKALEQDRERRYASARELAEDLRRFLRHEPISALPASGLYHLKKFARRNRALSASLILAGAALVAATVVSAWQARVADRARERAEVLRGTAEKRSEEARRSATRAAIAGANVAAVHGDVVSARRLLESVEPGQRFWEWRHMLRRIDGRLDSFASAEALHAAVLADQGRAVAIVDAAGTITRWIPGADEAPACIDLGTRIRGPAAFDPEGRFLAAVVGESPTRVLVWDAVNGLLLAETNSAEPRPRSIAISANAGEVAFGAAKAFLWEPFGAHPPHPIFGSTVNAFAFSADGLRVASAYNHARNGPGWFLDYEASTGKAERARHVIGHTALGIALDEHGERGVVTYENKRAYLVRLGQDGVVTEFAGHLGPVDCAAFDPSSTRLATGSTDRTVRLWDRESGRGLAVLSGAEEPVLGVGFDAPGQRILARTEHGVGVWDAESVADDVLAGHSSYVYDVAFAGRGRRLISVAYDGGICVWDVVSRKQLWKRRPTGPADRVWSLSRTASGSLLALGCWGSVTLLDSDCMATVASLPIDERAAVRDVALTPDARILAGRTEDRVIVWDVASRSVLWNWPCRALTPYPAVAIAPGGAWVASNGRAGEIVVFDVATGAVLARLRGHEGEVEGLAFSPDGALLASGSMDSTVRLWSTRTWTEHAVLRGHTDRVYDLDFSPDGTRLASGSNDMTIRLWDVALGEEVAVLTGHDDYVFGLEFSPDGACLASASGDFNVRLWDTESRAQRRRAAQRARAAHEAWKPRVERLLAELVEPARVSAALRADGSLSEDEREAAYQALLQLVSAP